MGYIWVFLTGFALSGIWKGLHALLYSFLYRKKVKGADVISLFIVSVIPAAVIYYVIEDHPFHFENMADLGLWGIAVLTCALTAVFVLLLSKREKYADRKLLLKGCFDGILMEIPQRAMMQTFVAFLLPLFGKDVRWCVLINALIWCACIIFQSVVGKRKDYGELSVELISSFVFSMGIGYVFMKSGCIIFSMLAHAGERYLTYSPGIRFSRAEK